MNTNGNSHNSGEVVLVTGGAGYVGSVLVDHLLAQGFRVRALDALMHGSVPSLLLPWGTPAFEFMRGDVRDSDARARALDGVDAVVHLAAIVGDPACARDPELARDVNLNGTRAMLRDAEVAGVGRFIFASTCSNYGRTNGNGLANEDFELAPVSLYAETKVAAEMEVLRPDRSFVATCLRFATVYGTSPRMRFDLTVNEFTRDLLVKQELLVFGEQFWRPYIHVRDAAQAIAYVLATPASVVAGEVFNVGNTQENYRKLDIVDLLRERIPEGVVNFVRRDEDPRDYRVSFEKFVDRVGFTPSRTLGEGIDEICGLLRSGLIEDPYAASFRN